MTVYKIIKGSLLLVFMLLILVPLWISYFDRGHDKATIDELLSEERELSSQNLTLTGRPLFEFSCRYEDIDKVGELKNVLYYVPFVSKTWTPGSKVRPVVIFDSGKRSWDKGFAEAVKALDATIDSLKKIEGEIQVEVVYEKHKFFRFDADALTCLQDEKGIELDEKSELLELVVNPKRSMMGRWAVTFLAIVVVIILYVKVNKLRS